MATPASSVTLTSTDLDVLRFDCFLDDKIIDFYFWYLSSRFTSQDILLVPPVTTTCLLSFASHDQDALESVISPLQLPNKDLILFALNNADVTESKDDQDGYGDEGDHWSLVVFDRAKMQFVHHDSKEGHNEQHAIKLYEILKNRVGSTASCMSKQNIKKMKKKKKGGSTVATKIDDATSSVAGFSKGYTPQQSNSYDCGLYMLAIAEAICAWHVNERRGTRDNWFQVVKERVTEPFVEAKMRSDLLTLAQKYVAS